MIPKFIPAFLLLAASAFAAGPNPVPNAQISGSSTLSGTLTSSGLITGGTFNADVLKIGGTNTSALFDSLGAAAAAQSFAIQRANHTGTQPASTISDLAPVATSGSYGDLLGVPTIPTDTAQLSNGAQFLTFYTLPISTATSGGIISLATAIDVTTGTNTKMAVTPAALAGQTYQYKSADFIAASGHRYAVDTVSSAVNSSYSASFYSIAGSWAEFVDINKTWDVHPFTTDDGYTNSTRGGSVLILTGSNFQPIIFESVTPGQLNDKISTGGTAATITGTIPATQVSGLPTALPALGGTAMAITGSVTSQQLPSATTASQGAVLLATAVEVTAGTDSAKAVTPSAMAGKLAQKAPLQFSGNSFRVMRMQTRGAIIQPTSASIRESKVIKVGGTWHCFSDFIPYSDTSHPNSWGSSIYHFTTTAHPDTWGVGSWTQVGECVPKGTAGSFDAGGTATPSAAYLDGKIYIAYAGEQNANGQGSRYAGLSYSADGGTTWTKSGPLLTSVYADDLSIVRPPGSTRTYIYYSDYTASPRLPRCMTCDTIPIESGTWVDRGIVYSSTSNCLPAEVFWDRDRFVMLGGHGESTVYESVDGLTFTPTGQELDTDYSFTLHGPSAIIDGDGSIAGLVGYDYKLDASAPGGYQLRSMLFKKAAPLDYVARGVLLSSGSLSTNTYAMVMPPRGYPWKMNLVQIGISASQAASDTAYWTFTVVRRVTGQANTTIATADTKAGLASYDSKTIFSGSQDIAANECVMFWCVRTGSPDALATPSVEIIGGPE